MFRFNRPASQLYSQTAALISAEYTRALRIGDTIAPAAIARLAHRLAAQYAENDKHFDRRRWLCACGL